MNHLNYKDINIIKYFLNNDRVYIKDLIKEFQCSEMTIRNQFKKINNFLSEHSIPPISKIDNYYVFSETNYEQVLKKISTIDNFSSEERFQYLILDLIFNDFTTLLKVSKIFDVTRQTLFNDIIKIKKFLKPFGLEIESTSYKGIYLKGDLSKKIDFSIKFLLKRLLERDFNPNTEKLYNNKVNPKIIELLREVVSEELESTFYNFTRNICSSIPETIGIYQFNSIVAFLIFLKSKNNTNIINFIPFDHYPSEVTDEYNRYWEIIKNSKYFKELQFLGKDLKIIAFIILKSHPISFKHKIFHDNKLEILVKELESNFRCNFLSQDKRILSEFFGTAQYKFKFGLTRYNIRKENLPNRLTSVFEILKFNFEKHLGNIYEEDLVMGTFLMKNILKQKIYSEIPDIFIVDYSVSNWVGDSIKDELLKNYKVKNVDVSSIYTEIDWDKIKKTYKKVFFIDINSNLINRNLNLEYHRINPICHHNNPYYFEKFGVKRK
ncbi:MAG: helix-turn-helix domain-containing protein [Cetobacterium sp.]|uniref:helix-turn-helix domain-containing protein n=1 Tax=Cetobacterium sp. TaxID=2071632 RepID=UPI002FCA0637